jgi:hypothetical protein
MTATPQIIFSVRPPQSQSPATIPDDDPRSHNSGFADDSDVTAIKFAFVTLPAILAAMPGGAR